MRQSLREGYALRYQAELSGNRKCPVKAPAKIKRKDRVEILLQELDCNKKGFFKNIRMNISLHKLTWRNIRVLEESLDTFAKKIEVDCAHLSEKEKAELHYDYRLHPIVELRNLIRTAIEKTAGVECYNTIL